MGFRYSSLSILGADSENTYNRKEVAWKTRYCVSGRQLGEKTRLVSKLYVRLSNYE